MKGVLKVTKEQVLEVEHYCNEHGVTRKQRISELGLSITSYYYTRGLLTDDELREGHFVSDSRSTSAANRHIAALRPPPLLFDFVIGYCLFSGVESTQTSGRRCR